jgi:hypothetical protein
VTGPRRRSTSPATLGLAVALAVSAATATEPAVTDPVDAFVHGYDPSNDDFFIHAPERTVLLRLRLDLDADGVPDLAVSEGSIWGQAGGPWLIFLGEPDGRYTYVGELFFSPATLAVQPVAPGTAELTSFERFSASGGRVVIRRLSRAGIAPVRDFELDRERDADRETYRSLFPGPGPRAESCRLLDYRRDPVGCWQPGIRIE